MDTFLCPMICLAMNSFCKTDLTSNQKVAGYSHTFHGTIAPVGMSYQAGCYYSSGGSQLGKLGIHVSPLLAL